MSKTQWYLTGLLVGVILGCLGYSLVNANCADAKQKTTRDEREARYALKEGFGAAKVKSVRCNAQHVCTVHYTYATKRAKGVPPITYSVCHTKLEIKYDQTVETGVEGVPSGGWTVAEEIAPQQCHAPAVQTVQR